MSIQKRNSKNLVRLREKKLSKGNVSLYLDVYQNGQRQYEFLRLYIKDKPASTKDREHNKEVLSLAEDIRAKRESEVKHTEYGFISPNKRKTNFLDYFKHFLDTYPNKDIRIVKYCFEHFKTFIGKSYLAPAEIDEQLLIQFKTYLENKVNGETPYNYFSKLKKVLKQARQDNVLFNNPAENIKNTRNEGLKKDILSVEEIQKLSKTECGNPEVKRAFLFCLNTGLRFCDVKVLKWNNVNEERLIIKSQQKTGKPVYIDLNVNAKKLLGKRGAYDELVFKLPSLTSAISTVKYWAREKAGIQKNITWHSSRHSFAVNLLIYKTDIKTVSSLLGHSGLKHTEKYTRVIDGLKKEAVNNLPEIGVL